MKKFQIIYSAILFYVTILFFIVWLIVIAPMLNVGENMPALIITTGLLLLVCCNVAVYNKDNYNKILPKWFRDN